MSKSLRSHKVSETFSVADEAAAAVTDFLDFYVGSFHWPAFNIADIMIVLGAALIFVFSLNTNR